MVQTRVVYVWKSLGGHRKPIDWSVETTNKPQKKNLIKGLKVGKPSLEKGLVGKGLF